MQRFLTIVGLAFGLGCLCGYMLGCQKPPKAPVDERRRNDVILLKCGPNKIGVIRLLRELTGLGLKETKSLVDNVPSTIMQDCEPNSAQKAVERLKELGAEAEIR